MFCVSVCYCRREALILWKSRHMSEATYRALIELAFSAGRVHLADRLCELVRDISCASGMLIFNAINNFELPVLHAEYFMHWALGGGVAYH